MIEHIKRYWLIINLKTLIVVISAVISTAICIHYDWTADFPLTIISTAIVFPIVFSIGGAYKRREAALDDYGLIKSHGKAIYFATRDWLENPSEETLEKSRQLLGELLNHADNYSHNQLQNSGTTKSLYTKTFLIYQTLLKLT